MDKKEMKAQLDDAFDLYMFREMRVNKARPDVLYDLGMLQLHCYRVLDLFPDVIRVEPTDEEKAQWGPTLCGIALYGDTDRFPILDDDAGQCEIVVIYGEHFPMGTYNFFETYKNDVQFLAEQIRINKRIAALKEEFKDKIAKNS